MVRVGIVGGASYVAGKLLELGINHPELKFNYIESGSSLGKPVAAVHTKLRRCTKLKFSPYNLQALSAGCDLVFIAKPHTEAMDYVLDIKETGLKIIDLSGDFRLKDPSVYQAWYKTPHKAPALLSEAVYGLPELNAARIAKAQLVANPGCYPTAAILGFAPLMAHKLISPDEELLIIAYSGLSGAGRTPKPGRNMFLDAYGNLKPYSIGRHPHTPEMEQELSGLFHGKLKAGASSPSPATFPKSHISVEFIPHLAPLDRGIFCTMSAELDINLSLDELRELYVEFYREAPFVRIYDPGEYPEVQAVAGTNFCDIGLSLKKYSRRVVVFSTIDNSIKGAAGQALQNLNLMCGFDQELGLPFVGNKKPGRTWSH